MKRSSTALAVLREMVRAEKAEDRLGSVILRKVSHAILGGRPVEPSIVRMLVQTVLVDAEQDGADTTRFYLTQKARDVVDQPDIAGAVEAALQKGKPFRINDGKVLPLSAECEAFLKLSAHLVTATKVLAEMRPSDAVMLRERLELQDSISDDDVEGIVFMHLIEIVQHKIIDGR